MMIRCLASAMVGLGLLVACSAESDPGGADEPVVEANVLRSACGNGRLESGEECDDANHSNNDSCLNNCKRARCGDGFVGPGEQCDDANGNNNDSCTNSCRRR